MKRRRNRLVSELHEGQTSQDTETDCLVSELHETQTSQDTETDRLGGKENRRSV